MDFETSGFVFQGLITFCLIFISVSFLIYIYAFCLVTVSFLSYIVDFLFQLVSPSLSPTPRPSLSLSLSLSSKCCFISFIAVPLFCTCSCTQGTL